MEAAWICTTLCACLGCKFTNAKLTPVLTRDNIILSLRARVSPCFIFIRFLSRHFIAYILPVSAFRQPYTSPKPPRPMIRWTLKSFIVNCNIINIRIKNNNVCETVLSSNMTAPMENKNPDQIWLVTLHVQSTYSNVWFVVICIIWKIHISKGFKYSRVLEKGRAMQEVNNLY